MKKGILLFAVSAFVLAPFFAYGATFRAGSNYYLEPKDTINDNLYSAGGNVNIMGGVNGDVFAAGGSLIFSGPISGDLAAAGGNITVSSNVSGDMRIAGGNVLINNVCNGELVAAGGQITVASGASFAKDGAIAGGNINYEGKAGGDLDIKGNSAYINGTVAGNLAVKAQEVKFGPNAVVNGNFEYYSLKEAVMDPGAKVLGSVNFHRLDVPKKAARGGFVMSGVFGIAWLIKSLMLFAAVLIISYLFKNQTREIVEKSVSSFWKESLKGFIIIVLIPVASVISFITVVGAFLGVIALFFYAALIMIASIISVLVFSRLALKYVFKKADYWPKWWMVALFVIVFGFVSAIPIVGWLIVFVIYLAAFGSATDYIYTKIKK